MNRPGKAGQGCRDGAGQRQGSQSVDDSPLASTWSDWAAAPEGIMSLPGYPPLGSDGNLVDGPREYSRDEIKDAFIGRIRTLLDYWER